MPKSPHEYWNQGVPLQEAWEVFATRQQRAARKVSGPGFPSAAELSQKSVTEKIGKIFESTAANSEFFRQKNKLINDMRRELIAKLIQGSLVAFGCPVYPSTRRVKRQIPAEFWGSCDIGSDIDWDRGNAADAAIEYQAIRIIDRKKFPELAKKAKNRTTVS